MEINYTCPLGHQCETVSEREGKPVVNRCAWYTQIAGKDPQGEEFINQWRCSLAWMPILLIENAQTNRGQTAAIESFRNETVRQQNDFLTLIAGAASKRQLRDAG